MHRDRLGQIGQPSLMMLTSGVLLLLTTGQLIRPRALPCSTQAVRLPNSPASATIHPFAKSPPHHAGPRVAAAITTSHRPLLFRRAMLSFRMRCLDCMELVETWFAVDDGSTPEQLAEMQATMPGLTWLPKTDAQHGHAGSLNVLLHAVRDFDYVVFIEDDFFFVKDESFVSRAIDVLNANAELGQVVFNERYALTASEKDREHVVGGVDVKNPSTGAVDYIMCAQRVAFGCRGYRWEFLVDVPRHSFYHLRRPAMA